MDGIIDLTFRWLIVRESCPSSGGASRVGLAQSEPGRPHQTAGRAAVLPCALCSSARSRPGPPPRRARPVPQLHRDATTWAGSGDAARGTCARTRSYSPRCSHRCPVVPRAATAAGGQFSDPRTWVRPCAVWQAADPPMRPHPRSRGSQLAELGRSDRGAGAAVIGLLERWTSPRPVDGWRFEQRFPRHGELA